MIGWLFRRSTILAIALAAAAASKGATPRTETVGTANSILSLRGGSGDLIGVQWRNPKLELIAESNLGENFRLLIPRPNYEANYFNSRDQVVSKIDRIPNGVVLHYGPLKNEREQINVGVAYEIRDTGTQLQFSIQITNRTNRKIAEVFYGIVGGQQGIQHRLDTESLVPGEFENLAPKLFSQYKAAELNIGGAYDFNGFGYPGDMPMGWMDVYNHTAGIGYYYANQDPESRVTMLYTEVRPYTKTMVMNPKDNWPRPSELPPGQPIGLTLGWVNFPYMGKGVFRAGPVALQVHDGDWREGARIYRAWYDQHFKIPKPNWLSNEMAWQSFIMLEPEDKINFRFKDLPRLAKDAKRYGVTTFEIEGWNAGGNDRGYPNFRPDPRLGTAEEFRKALAEMRTIGVHPIVMSEDVLADTATPAFKTQLSRYAVQGRWAPDLLLVGDGEGTIGSHNMTATGTYAALRHNSAVLSPSHPQFREELIRQYLQLTREGAEGLQLDVNPFQLLDFNPNVPTSPDRSLPLGILKTYQEYKSRAGKINPNVALAAGSETFDRALPYMDVYRNMLPGKDPSSVALRYTFPEWTAASLTITPGDLDGVSNGLRYGLVWLVNERLYGSMDDPLNRPLSRYVSELIRIRKQYPGLLFHGRFNDTFGAKVLGNKESIRYSVFQSMDASKPERACVVVNFGDDDENVSVSIDDKDGHSATISTPFQSDRQALLPTRLTVPAHSAAVVVAKE